MKAPNSQKDGVMAEINVTPLVDVMLVLLIIFIVAAPMLQQGVNVNLPKVVATDMPADPDVLVVSVDKSGAVFIGKNRVDIATLPDKVKAISEAKGQRDAYLRADKDVPYGVVVDVMSVMRRAGIERLGMVTEPLEKR